MHDGASPRPALIDVDAGHFSRRIDVGSCARGKSKSRAGKVGGATDLR